MSSLNIGKYLYAHSTSQCLQVFNTITEKSAPCYIMTCGYPKVQTVASAFVKALEMMTELCSNQYINGLCQLMNSSPVVSGGIESSSM